MLARSAGVPVKSDPVIEDDAVSVEPGEDGYEEAAITGGGGLGRYDLPTYEARAAA